MQIDWHVKMLGARQYGIEAQIVQESSVYEAVDQRAIEAKLGDAPLQLICSGFRRQHGQVCEAGHALRIFIYSALQGVVELAREGDPLRTGDQIGPWAGERQDLNGDASSIHVPQARRPKGLELRLPDRQAPGGSGWGEAAAGDGVEVNAASEGRDGEMLFQGNDAHERSPVAKLVSFQSI